MIREIVYSSTRVYQYYYGRTHVELVLVLESVRGLVLVLVRLVSRISNLKRTSFKGALKGFSNRIESEGLFRTSGNSRSLFLRCLALVEVFGDFSPQNRIEHVELL